jgi:phosphate transport system substrate-binding protein
MSVPLCNTKLYWRLGLFGRAALKEGMGKMMRRFRLCATLVALVLGAPVAAGDRIHIASSSTVAPFVSMAAEQFGHASGFGTPVVESIGSGGSLKLFCASAADGSPDIAGASRRIAESEIRNCATAGITDIVELTIGYDGIVLANAKSQPSFALTRRDLFLAIAKTVPVGGKLVPNPYRRWRDIDSQLPDAPIMVFGPAPNHGTRDVLAALVMDKACREFPEFAVLDDKAKRTACEAVREDGVFVEVTADYAVTLRKLEVEPTAIGILPFSYLDQNGDKIQAATFDGKRPTYDAIYDGSYPLSRPLFVYVKKDHLQVTRGIREFLAELTSEKAAGKGGYLSGIGLIALPEERRKAEAAKAQALPTL